MIQKMKQLSFDYFKQSNWALFIGPMLVIVILAMMILPLPPFLLDLLFTFNIVLAIMVLLVAVFTEKVLDFAVFPTILLFSTLLRLSLNIASSRVILLNGHTGADAAGHVIEAFGHFLVGGNFAIGIVVFAILVIINFMVITKGAGRIAEVAARFILDGMPGKQMSIDADLNAGLIGESEAKRRRLQVTQEADFYGSMDGASKFVRGDAIAGLLIMAINIIGGLMVGVIQHGMPLAEAGQTFTLLTIGDGLVAQIPALVISTAAGVIVTRVETHQNISEQMATQLFNKPQVMLLTAIVVGLLGIIPGMPNMVFLLFTGILLLLSWWLNKQQQATETSFAVEDDDQQRATVDPTQEPNWNDVQLEDVLGLEVGYRLIAMVDDRQGAELINRIRGIRKKFAQDLGYLPPVVHIRDDLNLPPTHYRILLKGVEIGRGSTQPERWMAINSGNAVASLNGTECQEPVFGLPAVWIDEVLCEQAKTLGYTVVDASTVVATHLNHLLYTHADEIFGRQETQQLLDRVSKEMPKLVEELIPNVLSLTTLHKVLQNLLAERVSIRDMRSIIETLAEHAAQQSDADELTALVRVKLGRAITYQWFADHEELNVIGLDNQFERILVQAIHNESGIEPSLAETFLEQARQSVREQERLDYPVVLLVNHTLRTLLSRFLRRTLPQLAVLSNLEVSRDKTIKITSVIGSKS